MSPPPDARSNRRRPRIRWHVVYYLLAAFDVFTVCATLYLSFRLLDIYTRSVSQNHEWAAHVDEFSDLQLLAAAVNAPGNDVFESHDVPGESRRMAAAQVAFAEGLALARRHLAQAHPAESRPLLARLDKLERAMAEMTTETQMIFTQFGAGEPEQAARRMAAMDRKYAKVLAAFHELRGDVSLVQRRLFAEQTASARNLQRYEFLIAGLIVLMVAAAIVYGRRIEREMKMEAEVRETYRVHLEDRVEERTKALRESEAALAAAASDWRRTFDAIDSPVMVLDLEGRLVRANAATVHALGGKGAGDEDTGRLMTSMGESEPWQTAARVAAEAREARAPRSAEALDAATGRSWDIAAYLAHRWGNGAGRIIVVVKDTTRLLELRETLRREENMAAMGTLVAGVAHEVRNPLFAISSTVDAFEARFGDMPGLEKYFSVLRIETERLGRLMRDLLEYGKPPRMETAPVDLRSVVEEAVRANATEAAGGGVTVADETPTGLPEVVVDAERMAQVFQNVIQNAVLHTPAGGRVTVAAGVRDGQGRRWMECSVRDSGPGFRAADLPHVFRPLFTRRPGGTGLGLAIAQRIVEMHGGAMTAANSPEGGAIVTVRLPLEAARGDVASARPLV